MAEEIARAGGSARFLQADVTRLPPPAALSQFVLLLDLGCLNGILPALRGSYALVVAQQARPGALFLLYAHLPDARRDGPLGCAPEEIDHLFAAAFHLKQRVFGKAPQGGQSMWNWLQRVV